MRIWQDCLLSTRSVIVTIPERSSVDIAKFHYQDMYRRVAEATKESKSTSPSLEKNLFSGTQTFFQTILASTL